MINLYTHQKTGKADLLTYKKYCLFYEVGTGKTYTALAALKSLAPCKVLIAAPKRVLDKVWLKQDVYDLSEYDVTYLNYEKIARDKTFIYNQFDVIILDEVHRIKGRTTNTSKRIKAVTAKAEFVWGLTGTPVANNYADVYNIYRNMNIIEFNMTYDEFITRYYYIKRLDSSTGFSFPILLGTKKHLVNELMTRIGKHSKTVRMLDCLELPPKTTEVIKIKGMVTEQYREISKGIFRTEEYEKTMIQLETLQKLHQASNGFVYDHYKNVITLKENKKLKELNDILIDLLEETNKVIIVYYYQKDLEDLKQLPYKWTLDSDEFEKDETQIMFIQYQQSEGLNLQFCNQMIFYTYDYSFLNYEQMCGRIYRSGQNNPVKYTILINEGTVEEKIWWAISNKKSRDEYLKEVLSDD